MICTHKKYYTVQTESLNSHSLYQRHMPPIHWLPGEGDLLTGAPVMKTFWLSPVPGDAQFHPIYESRLAAGWTYNICWPACVKTAAVQLAGTVYHAHASLLSYTSHHTCTLHHPCWCEPCTCWMVLHYQQELLTISIWMGKGKINCLHHVWIWKNGKEQLILCNSLIQKCLSLLTQWVRSWQEKKLLSGCGHGWA